MTTRDGLSTINYVTFITEYILSELEDYGASYCYGIFDMFDRRGRSPNSMIEIYTCTQTYMYVGISNSSLWGFDGQGCHPVTV